MSHTQGKWVVEIENRGAIPEHFRPYSVVVEGKNLVICRLPDGRSKEDTANATLIAEAPTLLHNFRELELCVRQYMEGSLVSLPTSLLPMCRESIARATPH